MVANPPKTARNAEIHAHYEQDRRGLAWIGRKYGISPGRVRQIVDKEQFRARQSRLESFEARALSGGSDD